MAESENEVIKESIVGSQIVDSTLETVEWIEETTTCCKCPGPNKPVPHSYPVADSSVTFTLPPLSPARKPESSPLESIQALLGKDVVLLPVPTRKKFPSLKGWQEMSVKKMDDRDYRAKFTGNIGVLLGKASGNLCSIDVDSDDDFVAFLAANPQFQDTLQTRGARGGNIWIRVSGQYPELAKLKRSGGSPWGEFRSDGGQTIVHGIHPDGMPYQRLVNRQPMEIAFRSIIWPDDLVLPWIKSDYELLVEEEGDPIQYDGNNRPSFNEPALAAKFAMEHLSIYEMGENQFYQYDDSSGLWLVQTPDQIRTQFSDDLKLVSTDLGDKRILVQRTTQRLTSLASFLKGQIGAREVFAVKRSLVHCRNGVLDLAANPPVFRTFSAADYSRNASPIAYDPNARCPRFRVHSRSLRSLPT